MCVCVCLLTCLAVRRVWSWCGWDYIIGSYRACFTEVVQVCCLVLLIADVLMIRWKCNIIL